MAVLFFEAVLLAVLAVLAVFFSGEAFWFLWIFAAADFALLMISFLKKLQQRKNKEVKTNSDKVQDLHIDDTFEMSGGEFENYVAELYKRLGYKIIGVKKSCDNGIDIIVRRIFKTGLQAKCYDRPVGVRAIQEAAAGKKYYGLKKVAVVTNSIFTASAKSLAAKNGVKLIDRTALATMAKKTASRRKK